MREIIKIKCDKCGCTNVVDELEEELKVSVLSIEEYIKKNRSESIFGFGLSQMTGVSHMDKRRLRCPDCGHTILYDKVIYT
jgi:predicted nucleic-acid-binding Zn-ribbon protein